MQLKVFIYFGETLISLNWALVTDILMVSNQCCCASHIHFVVVVCFILVTLGQVCLYVRGRLVLRAEAEIYFRDDAHSAILLLLFLTNLSLRSL
jgi:hypothetical protein